ncbi:MAG: small, acid-soluble spore protein, alpha/beta type [Desulfitobacterium hafniense]|nr:small, acid-soluble spore protein, alpha/beta type [Desulfitobacterium hafniense]
MAKYNLPVDKNSIAGQMGVQLGGDRTSRENGRVGGEMVRRTFESFGRTK